MKIVNEIKQLLEFHKKEFKDKYGVKTNGFLEDAVGAMEKATKAIRQTR